MLLHVRVLTDKELQAKGYDVGAVIESGQDVSRVRCTACAFNNPTCKHANLAKAACDLAPLVYQSGGPPIRELLDAKSGELLPNSVTRV